MCSDNQSLVKALERGPLTTDPVVGRIWWHLVSLTRSSEVRAVVVQWVPGHVGLPRMVEVDKYVRDCQKSGRLNAYQDSAPSSLAGTKCSLRRQVRDRWLSELCSERRLHLMGTALPKLRVSGQLSRTDETLLAQICTGQSKHFGPLRHKLGLMPSAACRWCRPGSAAPVNESPAHLLLWCPDQRVRDLRADVAAQVDLSKAAPLAKMKAVAEMQAVADFYRALATGP